MTRFLAAITVVFFHFGYTLYPFNVYPWDNLFLLGPISVCYFFTLSGFIMVVVYYRPDSAGFSASGYWAARIARIYPVYIVSLLIATPFLLGRGSAGNDQFGLVLNVLLLQAWVAPYPLSFNFPSWSLSVEAFFYLVFPWLLPAASRLSTATLVVSCAGIWAFSQSAIHLALNCCYPGFPSTIHYVLYYNPVLHLNTFLLGVCSGVIFVRHLGRYSMSRTAVRVLLALLVMVLVMILLVRHRLEDYLGFRVVLENGLLAPLFAGIIVVLSLETGLLARMLSSRPAQLLGDASYSIYILQFPLHWVYAWGVERHFELPQSAHFVIFVLLLVAVSIAVLLLFERPARRRLRDVRWRWLEPEMTPRT